MNDLPGVISGLRAALSSAAVGDGCYYLDTNHGQRELSPDRPILYFFAWSVLDGLCNPSIAHDTPAITPNEPYLLIVLLGFNF